MPSRSLPTRTLREHPNLDQLKRQARELLGAFRAGESDAIAEASRHYRGADPTTFALQDAQLVIARAYGFDSWPKLKAYVDGVTVAGLADAVHADDIAKVRAMLAARSELVHMDMSEHNEHRVLHYAVLDRNPEMVRILMEHGADPLKGIWPHRSATGALTIAPSAATTRLSRSSTRRCNAGTRKKPRAVRIGRRKSRTSICALR